MAWVAVAGAAVSLLPAGFKAVSGANQRSKARNMNLVNPGYRINQGVIDNAREVTDTYNNYRLPGFSAMRGDIDTTFNNAFSSGVEGASSSGDILDLATKMAYGKNNALNQLGVQNASGKQALLGTVMNARAAAGQEYQNQNAWERELYTGQVREKAALEQAGTENIYGALDQAAGAGSKFLFNTSMNNNYSKYFYSDGSPRVDAAGRTIPPQTAGAV